MGGTYDLLISERGNTVTTLVLQGLYLYRRTDQILEDGRECLTLKIPRLANWHEFARLTQGNILAPDFPPEFQGPGWWV